MKINKILVLLATCLVVSTPSIAAETLPKVSYLKNTETGSDFGSNNCYLKSDQSKNPKPISSQIYGKDDTIYRFNLSEKDIELKATSFFIDTKGKVLTSDEYYKRLKKADMSEYTDRQVFQHQGIKVTLDYGKQTEDFSMSGDQWQTLFSKLIIEGGNMRKEIPLVCYGVSS